ncbi:MAG TPA: PA0069 family radical SAM protein [Caulifigura sp.]|nr:PA0069 family radical SAM protein [Caulifigura sp.]
MSLPPPKGRGSPLTPPNRFGGQHEIADLEQVADDEETLAELARADTVYLPDDSRSVISENDSPDLSFRYSLNPYRGCLHGCSYCYARPTHEYLGLNAGIDFETKIFVKHKAPELFRDWLSRDKYQPETVMLSGVTDCYQPAERQYQLTRRCLEVARDAGQPMGIVTKNALVTRDLDILSAMAARNTVAVAISVTSLRPEITADLEPRSSRPEARLRAIRELSAAGVPVRVMVAPIIPGLTDSETPAILQAAREAGARFASYTLVRLPWTVRPVFQEWLDRTQSEAVRDKISSLILHTRDGKWNDASFGSRMKGQGAIAQQIASTFKVFATKLGYNRGGTPLETKHFRPPVGRDGQLRLF